MVLGEFEINATLPLVSVCVPTRNGALYLEEALLSIKNQTYPHLEVIVSDDSSTDRTVEIVEGFKKVFDKPIRLCHHSPNGIAANWNNATKNATGKYIKFLFQDDILYPSCIEKMVWAMESYPSVRLVASKRDFIFESNITAGAWEKLRDLQATLCLPNSQINLLNKKFFSRRNFYSTPLNKIGEPSTVMYEKALVEEIGEFDTRLEQILDYEYWYRILKKHNVAILNESLVGFRVHENQATNRNKHRRIADYDIYTRILRHEYYNMLHPKVKIKIALKCSLLGKAYLFIKKVVTFKPQGRT
jgi:glycosyltransferase involved in cell wall biosynthesis